MATDLDDRPETDAGSDALNPGQQHYDDTVNRLGSKENREDGGFFKAGDDGKSAPGSGGGGSTDSSSDVGGVRGLYNRGKDTKQRFGNRARSFMRKKWVIGAVAGGGSIGMLLILLILLSGALKIPHLAQNITAYQFVRVTRQMSGNTRRLLSEKISIASASKSVDAALEKKFTSYSGVKDAWAKLDKFRPNKVIDIYQGSGEASLQYGPDRFGRQIIKGIQLNNTSIRVSNTTTLKRLVPGFKLANNIKFAQDVAPTLNAALKSNDIGPITRWRIMTAYRKELGVSLFAWKYGEFSGKTPSEAQLQAARNDYRTVKGNTANTAATDELKNAAKEAAKAQDDVVASDTELAQTINKDGGKMKGVRTAIADSLKDSKFSQAVGVVNSFYALALPACIIYDGSVEHSGPTIDQQMGAQVKSYYILASAADEQKDGTAGSPEATGAYNEKYKDINGSIPMLRASGETVDTSGYPSAESGGAGGTFSIANAVLGSNAATQVINYMGDKACPTLTDLKLAGAIGLGNLVLAGLSLGGTQAAEKVAQKGAESLIGRVAEKVAATVIRKRGAVNVSGKVGDVLTDAGKSATKVAGLTILAKLFVMSRSGYTNNGLEQGSDAAAVADAGGNITANETERKQFYGMPLTKTAAADTAQENMAFLNEQNASKSVYQRYFALSNSQSLLTKFSMSTASSLSSIHIPSLLKNLGNLLDPTALFSTIFNHVNPQVVHAAAAQNAIASNYGNVQFGFTRQEEALMETDGYQHLQNQLTLDRSGKEDAIDSHYGKCFTVSMGTLLSEGDIVLDENNNVVASKGLCAPNNLSFNNQDRNGPCGGSGCGDLVFRYRVAHGYNNTVDQLLDSQTLTEEQQPVNSGAGTSFRIATQNVLGAGHPSPLSYTTRGDRTVNTILTKKLDIVGFQEFTAKQRNYIYPKLNASGTTYGIFPAAKSHNVDHSVENSIIWNSDKFVLVGSGQYQPNLRYFCGNHLNAPYVKLQSKDSGQQFYVLNTHDPANSDHCPSDSPKYRYYNALEHAKFMKQLESEGLPVLYTGDFNSKYALVASGNGSPYQGKKENLTYCILAVNGSYNDAYDVYAKRKVSCPNKTPIGNEGGIDHVYLSKNIAVTAYDYVHSGHQGDGPNGADHPTVIFDVTIPGSTPAATPAAASGTKITKVLTIVEENHSLAQMKKQMPYAFSLAQQYGYATNYTAIRHPSLPNYISIAAGNNMGVADDKLPSAHKLSGQSVFGQALANGATAKLYAESMSANCVANSDSGNYRSKHNPWTYFVDERTLCKKYDVPLSQFNSDVSAGTLPNVGMLIPNMCNDAHNCSLATADNWFKKRMQAIFAGPDWKSGQLAVVLTADEDDSNSGNQVLTVVIHPSLKSKVVTSGLNHYSLSRLYSNVVGLDGLRDAKDAPSISDSFGLPL